MPFYFKIKETQGVIILNFKEAFKILEIEPIKDKREIKIAYSKMLKKYHPEEFPDVFIQINEAYKVALEHTENEFLENPSENAAENQQESVQTADKTHSVWYLFGAAVSAILAGFAGSKRKKKSDEEL